MRASWLFRFDWYMRTRTQAELGKRVELLARLIEKEAQDEAEAAKKARRQSKGGGGGGKAGAKRNADDDAAPPSAKRGRRE